MYMYTKKLRQGCGLSWLNLAVCVFIVGGILSVAFLSPALAMMAYNGEEEEEQIEPYPQVAWEEDYPAGLSSVLPFLQAPVVTSHHIRVKGEVLYYTATAGFLPMTNYETGEDIAFIYYTAYELEGVDDPAERPVTFLFNGGPGVSSIYLHIGAFGPKIAPRSPDGTEVPAPPYRLSENEHTLLAFTDLVFIDPVGTGFSRARTYDEARLFWGVREDILTTTEFIRLFLNRHERWLSPLFVAGESYGGIRAAGLASALQEVGIFPSGIVLISPILNYLGAEWVAGGTIVNVLSTPVMAAIAWYHGKVDHDPDQDMDDFMEEVREWSRTEYLLALNRGNTLGQEERKAVAAALSGYIGLPQTEIEYHNLRIDLDYFLNELLKDQSLFLSPYDGRVTGIGTLSFIDDPSSLMVTGPFIGPFNDYLRRELGLVTDLNYIDMNEDAFVSWNFMSGTFAGNMGYPETASSLETALRRTGFLRIFAGIGLYDAVTPYDHTRYMIDQFDLPPDRLENITFALYEGGHMMYLNPSELARLREDLAAFYRETLR